MRVYPSHTVYESPDEPGCPDLEEIHARMRARDRERIEKGEATPEQIQEENSIIPKPKSVFLPKLT